MSLSEAFVADVTDGLLREYLHKLGCKRTLQVFDEERPRHANSISSRNILRKTLGLEKVAHRLKKQDPDISLPPTLEMWVENQLEKVNSAKSPTPAPELSSTAPQKPAAKPKGWDVEEESQPMTVPTSSRPVRPPSARSRGGPVQAASDLPRKPKLGFDDASTDSDLLNQLGQSGARGPRSMQQQPRAQAKEDVMMMEDVDDFDADMGSTPIPTHQSSVRKLGGGLQGDAISPDEVRQLKELLWGNSRGPPPSWKQGFFFSKAPGLAYGLVQKEGGPCGVLAAVQAHVLDASFDGRSFDTSPSTATQSNLLCKAIAAILWQAGSKRKALLVGSSEPSTSSMSYESLGRSAIGKECTSLSQLEDGVRRLLPQYTEEKGYGLVLFLFSLMLTRRIKKVRGDMDQPENSMMGAHGYCTQDLVNLIISGRACSNVFDGIKELDEHTTLKGVKAPSRVGLLTLFEWYKYVEVGGYLKNPEVPVWVVCSESHFTCLFAMSTPARLPLDLMFYDGLANQEAPIKLSLSKSPTGGHTARAGDTIGDRGKSEDNLVPPLEFVVETRWPGVDVDWNGSEPIL